jgi:hypothetical protein
VALSVAPATIAVATGNDELSMAVVAAVVIGGAVAAFAADDVAGNVVAATPASLARRRGRRLAVLGLFAGVIWALVAVAVLWRDPHAADRVADRLAELAAISGLSAAAGASADRRDLPVVPAAVVGPMTALLMSSFAYRFPQLPTIGGSGDAGAWTLIAALGWGAAAWESRDLYGFAVRRPAR